MCHSKMELFHSIHYRTLLQQLYLEGPLGSKALLLVTVCPQLLDIYLHPYEVLLKAAWVVPWDGLGNCYFGVGWFYDLAKCWSWWEGRKEKGRWSVLTISGKSLVLWTPMGHCLVAPTALCCYLTANVLRQDSFHWVLPPPAWGTMKTQDVGDSAVGLGRRIWLGKRPDFYWKEDVL